MSREPIAGAVIIAFCVGALAWMWWYLAREERREIEAAAKEPLPNRKNRRLEDMPCHPERVPAQMSDEWRDMVLSLEMQAMTDGDV